MLNHEAAGGVLAPSARKNLPNRILRAFDNAKHLVGLKRGVKDTLAELCRFVPQNRPFDTIFAHKATIAKRIDASERTIYRHLETLRERCLIEVLEQERKSLNGRFAVSRIRLTRRAAALLGFIDAPEELTDTDEIEVSMSELASSSEPKVPTTTDEVCQQSVGNLPSVTLSEIYATQTCESRTSEEVINQTQRSLIHSVPTDKMSCGHMLSEPTNSKNQPPRSTENGLPIDLTCLTANGISRAGVFKLMAIAKAHGKLLSDIVTVVHKHLNEVKGGRLYSYLSKLATGPTDFTVPAANERRRIADAKQERAFERKAQLFRTRFGNTILTNRKQTRLYLIDAKAKFVQVLQGSHSSTTPLNDLAPWISRLESGELILATLETERRFLTLPC